MAGALYCCANASGPLQGNEAERGSAGYAKVVGPVGHRLGEIQGEVNRDGLGVRLRFGVRHGWGGGTGNRKQGKQLQWGGMERRECRQMYMKAT